MVNPFMSRVPFYNSYYNRPMSHTPYTLPNPDKATTQEKEDRKSTDFTSPKVNRGATRAFL